MPAIRLWYSPGACSLAPHILLNETGLPFEAIKVPIRESAHLTDAFIRLNPKKRLPVLALDDEVITELPAVATAIAHLAPERHLMGRSALDQTRVYEWMNWLSGTLHAQGFGCLWRPHRFSDVESVHASITAKGRGTIAECFAMIEDKVNGAHAVGDGFTGVDAFLIVFYRWGNLIGFDMAGAYPHYSALIQGLVERDAVQRALAIEDIRIEGAN